MPTCDNKIRILAVAVIQNGDRILANRCEDPKDGRCFYRLPGGGTNFGERTEEALVREFSEELGAKINITGEPNVVQNIFEYNGRPGHEICFIYRAEFVDKSLYDEETIPMIEEEHSGEYAEWIDPNGVTLFPGGWEDFL